MTDTDERSCVQRACCPRFGKRKPVSHLTAVVMPDLLIRHCSVAVSATVHLPNHTLFISLFIQLFV